MANLKLVTEDEMRERLEEALRQNHEDRLVWQSFQKLKDPACAPDKGYRQYVPPLLAILLLLTVIVAATFIYFSFTT